jgi:DNA-directed RNA polymerase specialized sigma24 family protein
MPDSGSRGSRGDPRPPFFDSFDSDPPDAKAEFVAFSTAFLTAHPPPSMKRLERHATRAGLIFELNERLCADNFKKLKTYKNIGSTFQSWLWVVAERWCADLMRAHEPEDHIIPESDVVIPDGHPTPSEAHPDAGTPADELAIRAQQIEKIKRCLARMNPECRLLLTLWSEGWTPRDLIVALRSTLDNVQMGNRLHECRRVLRKLMLDAGLGGSQ